MTFDLVTVLLILLLLVREVFHAVEVNRLETRRELELERQGETYSGLLKQSYRSSENVMDRLMARNLTEHKSWSAPPAEPKPAEEVDSDWMKPSFAMPDETNP